MSESDMVLPSEQGDYDALLKLSELELFRRRELVFLLLSGIFLGTLAMLNILGISRFIDLSFSIGGLSIPMVLAVGVLPYPVTFLCTDLISELYGKKRASQVVWVGLLLNVWVMFVLWLGGALPGVDDTDNVFLSVRTLAFGAVIGSMIAYLFAQFVDVHLFHLYKRWTKGRHLWLRNNGSTLISQLVDTVLVIGITYTLGALPMNDESPVFRQLAVFVASGYSFKLAAALFDTGPFYASTWALRRYLRLPLFSEADA